MSYTKHTQLHPVCITPQIKAIVSAALSNIGLVKGQQSDVCLCMRVGFFLSTCGSVGATAAFPYVDNA